jgi:hypothetical protein
MMDKPWIILIAAVGLMTGCGNENSGSASTSASAIGQGLAPGQFELEVVGYVRSVGPYSGGGEAVSFTPSNYGRSRERQDGTGGRQHVSATNADGPYRVRMQIELQRRDEEPDSSSVTIQLPPGARAGQTYPLETPHRARHGEAILAIMGYGQSLTFEGSGTVNVVELDEHVSLQFEFHGGSPEHDNERHAIGRVYQVPLTRRGESQYQLIVDGQREDRADATRFRNDWSIQVAQEMMFDFPGDVAQPGTYRLASRRSPGVVSLSLQNYRGLDISGTLEVRRDGDTWSATFEFEGQGDVNVRGQGGFDHLPARPGHQ